VLGAQRFVTTGIMRGMISSGLVTAPRPPHAGRCAPLRLHVCRYKTRRSHQLTCTTRATQTRPGEQNVKLAGVLLWAFTLPC